MTTHPHVLITAFTPFGKRQVNATMVAVDRFADALARNLRDADVEYEEARASVPVIYPPEGSPIFRPVSAGSGSGNVVDGSQDSTSVVPTRSFSVLAQSEQQPKFTVTFAYLPVSFSASAFTLRSLAEEIAADAVISFGEDGTRKEISIETVGYNEMKTSMADNDGVTPPHEVFTSEDTAPQTVGSSLPCEALRDAVRGIGVSCELSTDPGRYVCNTVAYLLPQSVSCAGFVHVPALPEKDLAEQASNTDVATVTAQLWTSDSVVLPATTDPVAPAGSGDDLARVVDVVCATVLQGLLAA